MELQTIKNPITQQQTLNDFERLVSEDCKVEPNFEANYEATLTAKVEKIDICKEVKHCIQAAKENNEKSYSPAIKSNIRPKSKANDLKRPEYSYVALIYCALRQAPERRLQLSEIYRWIAKNYPFYKMGEKAWQNSIRHNLSLNDCFKKTPRETDKTGVRKGNWWCLSDDADDMFKDGSWKRRKHTKKGGTKNSKKNSEPLNEAFNYANYSTLSAAPNVLAPSASNYYLNSVHGVHSVPTSRPYYASSAIFSPSTENMDYIYNSMPQHSSSFASQFVGTQNYFDGNSYPTTSVEQRTSAQQLQHNPQSMQSYYNYPLSLYVNNSASTSTQPSEESRSPISQHNAQSVQSMCNAYSAYSNLQSPQSTASRLDYSSVAQDYASSNYCPIEGNTCYPYTSLYASLYPESDIR